MSWLSRLAERQIQKARLKGELQGLAGEGKPLPERPGDAFISAGEVVGFRIMAGAGVLPEEITLKKRVIEQRKVLAGLTDEAERKVAMAELARLEMLQAIAEESRRKFPRQEGSGGLARPPAPCQRAGHEPLFDPACRQSAVNRALHRPRSAGTAQRHRVPGQAWGE